jgi:hypothetical protein
VITQTLIFENAPKNAPTPKYLLPKVKQGRGFRIRPASYRVTGKPDCE